MKDVLDRPRLWMQMDVAGMRAYLSERQGVLLPVGCTEQHGYHLPLGVDLFNAEEVCKRASRRTGVVVAPTVNYTYSGGELPGTVNVAPHVLTLYLEEIVLSFCAQGFRHVYLVLGHGGSENFQALEALRDGFLRKHRHWAGKLVLCLVPLWKFGTPGVDCLLGQDDFHAGRIETSLMLHWAPDLVRMDRATVDAAPVAERLRTDPDSYMESSQPVDSPFVAPLVRQREDVRVGVFGYPEQATAEEGRRICETMVQGVVDLIAKVEGA